MVYNHQQYRDFIRERFEQMPRKGRGQVMRLAEHLRVNSTLVSQVLSGQKDFTIEQALEVADFFALSAKESEYFVLLVQRDRAGTVKLKSHFLTRLNDLKKESLKVADRLKVDRVLGDHERAIFYSSWLYSAVRLFCSLDDGKTLDDVIERFDIPRPRAAEILRFLVETGLCLEENSRFRLGTQRTHLEQGSPFLLKHHANWRLKSVARSESLSAEELMFTAPLAISRQHFDLLREDLVALIKKLHDLAKDSPSEVLGCMNLDLIFVD